MNFRKTEAKLSLLYEIFLQADCKGAHMKRSATDFVSPLHQYWIAAAGVLKMTMTIMWSSMFLQSKVSCFNDCNNYSQNKITHTNRDNNIHQLRQGMTFVVYTKELVVWQPSLGQANICTSMHKHIKPQTYLMRVFEKSNWDLNWLEASGPCLALWFVCLLFLSL